MKIKIQYPTKAYLLSGKMQVLQTGIQNEKINENKEELTIELNYSPKNTSHVHYISTAIGFYHGKIIRGKLIQNFYRTPIEITKFVGVPS